MRTRRASQGTSIATTLSVLTTYTSVSEPHRGETVFVKEIDSCLCVVVESRSVEVESIARRLEVAESLGVNNKSSPHRCHCNWKSLGEVDKK